MKTAANLKKTSTYSYRQNLANLYKKPAVQVSTALILTVLAITFFAIFAIRPTLATIVELNKRIDDQKTVVDKLEKKATALATAQSEYFLVEEKIPLIDAAIPKTNSLDTLLIQIEGIAASLNIPIDTIQVDEVYYPEGLVDKKREGEVIGLPLNITLSSSFVEVKEFMKMISSIKRLVSVESISFSSETSQESESLKMSLSVRAYHLPSIEEVE